MVIPIRGRLVVEGNVQGVGYRVIVRQIARGKGIKGKVKNLDDGNVEIYCEGSNQALVLEFVEAIKIKPKGNKDIFTINVENIKAFWDGDGVYKPLKKPMGRFKIDYDNGTTPHDPINLERLETGSLMMYGVNERLSTTHSDFKKLDGKYDAVSIELQSISNKISNMDGNISNMGDNISKLVDHLGKIIDRFVEDKTENEQQN